MKYKITLNGKTYEVEVEAGQAMLVDEYEAYAPAPAAPVAVAAAPAAAAPAEEKKAAEAKPGIEPINYEEDKAAAEAEKKTEEEDDPFAEIFKIFNRER